MAVRGRAAGRGPPAGGGRRGRRRRRAAAGAPAGVGRPARRCGGEPGCGRRRRGRRGAAGGRAGARPGPAAAPARARPGRRGRSARRSACRRGLVGCGRPASTTGAGAGSAASRRSWPRRSRRRGVPVAVGVGRSSGTPARLGAVAGRPSGPRARSAGRRRRVVGAVGLPSWLESERSGRWSASARRRWDAVLVGVVGAVGVPSRLESRRCGLSLSLNSVCWSGRRRRVSVVASAGAVGFRPLATSHPSGMPSPSLSAASGLVPSCCSVWLSTPSWSLSTPARDSIGTDGTAERDPPRCGHRAGPAPSPPAPRRPPRVRLPGAETATLPALISASAPPVAVLSRPVSAGARGMI